MTTPLLVQTSTIELQYPHIGAVTSTLVLPAPNFNNKESLTVRRITRQSRGLKRIVLSNPNWNKSRQFILNFSELTRDEVDSFHAFYQLVLGKEFKYLDYESATWVVMITDVSVPVTNNRRLCGYTLDLTLEGYLLSRPTGGL